MANDILASDLVSIPQAALDLEVRTQWIYELIKKGALMARQVGGLQGATMLLRQEIDQYDQRRKERKRRSSDEN